MTHIQQESPDIVGRRYRPTKIGRLSLKFRLLFSADHRLAKIWANMFENPPICRWESCCVIGQRATAASFTR